MPEPLGRLGMGRVSRPVPVVKAGPASGSQQAEVKGQPLSSARVALRSGTKSSVRWIRTTGRLAHADADAARRSVGLVVRPATATLDSVSHRAGW